MNEQIKNLINKVPIKILVFLFILYEGLELHQFTSDPGSPLNTKQLEIVAAKGVRTKLDAKIKEANAFVKTLEKKKSEILKLTLELQSMKETLSDRADVPTFMKMIITESKKLGVTVLSLKPVGNSAKEYYVEQNFKFTFRCVFAQLTSFLERLSNVSEIVRVESFEMKPVSNSLGKFVLLDVGIEMKTYKYVGSAADKVSGEGSLTSIETTPAPDPNPAGSPAQSKGGS